VTQFELQLRQQLQEHIMEKSGSFSQSGITREQAGAEGLRRTDFNANLRQRMAADDAQYHTEKLALGSQGSHEGWIKAEEAGASNAAMSAEARHEMISVAAYYLAEKRGFAGQGACDDWMKAEADIDARLHGGT
jgi:hypothetical protein